jgi:release factor glutamine methyltransferase
LRRASDRRAEPIWFTGPVTDIDDIEGVAAQLSSAGFVAASEEADELFNRADGDGLLFAELVERRLTGEPLAWITGSASFCGLAIQVDHGVYVPRWQSEPLARQAVERLPEHGLGIEICTGSGAIARTMMIARDGARVAATDIDSRAVACARANGVDAHRGDLFDPLPGGLEGIADVVVGVVPYVPTPALSLLPRDTLDFESPLSYDGGSDGGDYLRRAVIESTRFLRHGGALLLELGGDQAESLQGQLVKAGYGDVVTLLDEDGDVRGIEATYGTRP